MKVLPTECLVIGDGATAVKVKSLAPAPVGDKSE